jgi:hypothetical protein
MGVRIIDSDALTNEGKQAISRLKANSSRFCSGLVNKEYIIGSIDNSDYVLVSTDENNGIKGFATLLHPNPKKLFIDVICNVGITKQTLRTPQVSSRGNEILDKIVEFGRDTLKVAYLELHALEHVITYYSKFGWKFVKVNKKKQCVQYKDYSQEIDKLKNALANKKAAQITRALTPFNDFKETDRSGGYTMRLCLLPIIESIVKRRTPATLSRAKTRRTPATVSRAKTRKISRTPYTAALRRTMRRSRASKTIR